MEAAAPTHADLIVKGPSALTPPLDESFELENEAVPPLHLLEPDLIKVKMFPDLLSIHWRLTLLLIVQ